MISHGLAVDFLGLQWRNVAHPGSGQKLAAHLGHEELATPQAFYGESEYLEPRVPTMISDYGEIMLKWAIMRIGEKSAGVAVAAHPGVPVGGLAYRPSGVSSSSTPITGRLTLDGEYIPMEMRCPEHPNSINSPR